MVNINIASLSTMKDREAVDIIAIIADKKEKETTTGKPYLDVTIQDTSGTLTFPVWFQDKVQFEIFNNDFHVENIYRVKGKIGHYNEAVQIKDAVFEDVDVDTIDMTTLIPTYKISENVINYLEKTIKDMKHPWGVIAKAATGALGYDKKRWKEFITCPSAEKHHGNKLGGLLLHTVGMLRMADAIIATYVSNPHFYDASEVLDPDRLKCKVIMHDIAKPQEYDYKTIIRFKPEMKTNHLINGCTYLKEINDECGNILTTEQMEDFKYSILSHHGQWGPFEPKSLDDMLLHQLDMIDSKIVGQIEKK